MNANATFAALNNAGEGFDPADEIAAWTLVEAADTTDAVSVYRDESGATVLVGTDGSGDDDSRWAVRVPE